MIEQQVEIPTADGTVDALLVPSSSPGRGVSAESPASSAWRTSDAGITSVAEM